MKIHHGAMIKIHTDLQRCPGCGIPDHLTGIGMCMECSARIRVLARKAEIRRLLNEESIKLYDAADNGKVDALIAGALK